MSELWLKGGTALTVNVRFDIVDKAVIHIKDGVIRSIESNALVPPGARVVDTSRCLVLPGLINLHTHSPMTLLRGIAEGLPLKEWLYKRIFPLEQKFASPEFARVGTLLACLEMIKSGTTTFNDMYFFEDEVARASHEAGMRAVCGQTLVEISDVDNTGTNLEDKLEKFLASVSSYPRVIGAIAPHSVYGVKRETLEKIISFVKKRNLMFHVHVSETETEVKECRDANGMTPVEFFEDMGLWAETKVIAAHMCILTEKDLEIAGRRKVGVAHNIESNLKLASGLCPVVELRARGAKVGLGTDGVASNNNLNMLQELGTAVKIQSFRKGPQSLTPKEGIQMVTREAAEVLGLEKIIGSLEVGKSADIIAVDLSHPHMQPLYDPYGLLVHSASGIEVKHSIIAGNIVMEDYVVKTLDEKILIQEVEDWSSRIISFDNH